MAKKNKITGDFTTEERIKIAARIVFTKKGYAATRTRDIAEAAGINLALLNYYFRSKEKLFDLIMLESLQAFKHSLKGVLNDEKTTLEKKIEQVVSGYIDLLITQPGIPLFVLSELRHDPKVLISKMGLKDFIYRTSFMKQLKQAIAAGKVAPVHPLHFMINMLSMVIFPFVASPLLKSAGRMKEEEFNTLMTERKKLIPKWIFAQMKLK